MQFFQRFSNKLKNEVGGYLGQRSRNELSISTSHAGEATVHDLTVDSSETPASATVHRKFRTSIVPEILDEDDKEYEDSVTGGRREVYRSDKPKESLQDKPPTISSPTAAVGRVPRRSWQEPTSPEEKRVLGIPEPEPKDAVRIVIPGSQPRREPVPMGGARKGKPFKPVNTLESLRNHQDQLRYRRQNSAPDDGDRPAKLQNFAQAIETAKRPKKKPRLDGDAPSAHKGQDIINIDSAEEDTLPHKATTRPVSKRTPDHDPIESSQSRDDLPTAVRQSNVGRRKPLQQLHIDGEGNGPHDVADAARLSSSQTPVVKSLQQGMGDVVPSRAKIVTDRHKEVLYAIEVTPEQQSRASEPPRSVRRGYVPLDDSPDELHDAHLTIPEIPIKKATRNINSNNRLSGSRSSLERRPGNLITKGELTEQSHRVYRLKSLLGYTGFDNIEFELVLVPAYHCFWVFVLNPAYDNVSITGLSLDKVIRVCFRGRKVILHTSHGVVNDNKLHVEFESEKERVHFLKEISHLTLDTPKILEESEIRMEKKFQRYQEAYQAGQTESRGAMTTTQRQLKRQATTESQITVEARNGVKRPRLSDNLDSPDSPDVLSVITPQDRTAAIEEHMGHEGNSTKTKSTSDRIKSTMSRSEYFGTATPTRSTRSQAAKVMDTPVRNLTPPRPSFEVSDLIESDFKKPITILGPHKKKESLSREDVERLNDDEFLNDNLISFFLLHLQNQLDVQQLNRMHIFNTFFFSALTKDTRGRGNINYDAVARWTKNVDLFTRDFVVVPVNENFHWFVMIICNLPALKRRATGDETDEVDQFEKIPAPVLSTTNDTAGSTVPSPEETRESLQGLSLDDVVTSATTRSIDTGKSKARKVLGAKRKYDPAKPVIITLDSLDQGRSSTAAQLKKYISALAADPNQSGKTFSIEAENLPGMTAKQIPHQTNFSDCGLYLCMYLEQFMCNPDVFVHRVLQRDDSGERWPETISGRGLRERLARTINEISKRQQNASHGINIPALGSILIDMQARRAAEGVVLPTHLGDTNMDKASIQLARKRWETGEYEPQDQSDSNPKSPHEKGTGVAEKLSNSPAQETNAAFKLHSPQPAGTAMSPVQLSPRRSDGSRDSPKPLITTAQTPSTAFEVMASPATESRHAASELRSDKVTSYLTPASDSKFEMLAARSQSVSTDFLEGNDSWRLSNMHSNHNESSAILGSEEIQTASNGTASMQNLSDHLSGIIAVKSPTVDDEKQDEHHDRNKQAVTKEHVTPQPENHTIDSTTDDASEEMLV